MNWPFAFNACKPFWGAPLPLGAGAGGMGVMRHQQGGDA